MLQEYLFIILLELLSEAHIIVFQSYGVDLYPSGVFCMKMTRMLGGGLIPEDGLIPASVQ